LSCTEKSFKFTTFFNAKSGKILKILADFADFQVEEKPKNDFTSPDCSGILFSTPWVCNGGKRLRKAGLHLKKMLCAYCSLNFIKFAIKSLFLHIKSRIYGKAGRSFKNVVSHAKEYGFIFPSSEIYDGLSAVYDYGQNGAELKNNIKQYWWKAMVQLNENIVGIRRCYSDAPTTGRLLDT
jgi:hypothetical protein